MFGTLSLISGELMLCIQIYTNDSQTTAYLIAYTGYKYSN